jgi:hypothetical protein
VKSQHAPAAALPPQVHVFIRDWLSSNNVLLKGRAMRNGPSQTGATAAPSETTA